MILMNLFAGKQWKHRLREQIYGHGQAGKKESLGRMERVAWKPMTNINKIDIPWEFAVWLRKLKLELCNNLEGGMGKEMGGRFKRKGTYVYLWLSHADVGQKQTQYSKALSFN